jgi:regulator-associated protein of mTOR
MKERMKTVSVALVVCLNIGVDPPDVIKTTPCARLECWVDPHALPPPKAVDTIGKTLQMQYERWQPRARYKLCLDPTMEAVKKLCNSLRRNAKDERTLFHYNGHGVPKPTENGEIWVFNKDYTQYIPLSIYDMQQWLGSPSIYVFDCNCAGLIIKWFNKFIDQRQAERERASARPSLGGGPASSSTLQQQQVPEDHILLAACSEGETLPTNPDLPADIFTSCLTTPIKMALKWFVSQTIISGVTLDLIDHIPGRLNDRRTPLGELNWIFTAVTDTIAWHVLPRPLFQKLFRQDLLVACLFRNFLLAERIMRSCRCTPMSMPKLPPTYNHPMWQAWDLAADYCLAQLPKLIANPNVEFKHCTFFTEQLTAFEVWLEFGADGKRPPEQLPIVLQVLLSQQHRLRALVLLGKFLDLGPWAVNQGLSVGIFPYVLKLLQSPAVELREVLIFIWAKILAVDRSCRTDLVKENGQSYFISILNNHTIPAIQRTQTAFILSVICQNDARQNDSRPGGPITASQGQTVCLHAKLIQICLSQLSDPDPSLRRWVVFCLAKLWENYEDAKDVAVAEKAHEKLCSLLTDPVPEVRAAAVYALGTFMANESGTTRSPSRVEIEFNLGITLPVVNGDASPMVRRELAIALANFVHSYHEMFVEEAKRQRLLEYAQIARKQGAVKSDASKDAKVPPVTVTPAAASVPAQGLKSSSSSTASSASTASQASSMEKARGEGIARTNLIHLGIECQLVVSAMGGVYEEVASSYPVFEFIWKFVRSLAADPVPVVSQVTQHLVSKMRNLALQYHLNLLQSHGHDPSLLENLASSSSSVSRKSVSSSDASRNRSPAKRDATQSGSQSSAQSSNARLSQSTSAANLQSLNSSSGAVPPTSSGPPTPKKGASSTSASSSSRTLSGLSQLLPGARKSTAVPGLSASAEEHTLGTGSDENAFSHGLPMELASSLYDWACLSFSSPMMRPSEEDETTPDYSERRWRQQRNEHLLLEAQTMYADKNLSMPRKLENEIAILETDSQMVSSILFHSFEPIVVVSDSSRSISVWNWEEGQRMNKIDNKNASNSHISSLALLNEHDMALIAAGSDDGVVKIWGGIYNSSHRLVTAFRTFPDLQQLTRTRGAGLILEWQQAQDSLFAAGNVSVIRQWDLNRELTSLDIVTGTDAAVTCLTSDKHSSGKLIFAGFADGMVRLYDTRLAGSQLVQTFGELKGSPVVSVSRPQCTDFLICGSTSGHVKFWDCKSTVAANTISTAASSTALMQALCAHDQTPVIATGSTDQRIKVMNYKGEEISLIRYHDGFLGQRIGPVSSLSFHSCHNLLGAGFQDTLVSIYAGETFKAVST